MQEPRKENEVRGAADGEKFGEGLHERENNCLDKGHAD